MNMLYTKISIQDIIGQLGYENWDDVKKIVNLQSGYISKQSIDEKYSLER